MPAFAQAWRRLPRGAYLRREERILAYKHGPRRKFEIYGQRWRHDGAKLTRAIDQVVTIVKKKICVSRKARSGHAGPMPALIPVRYLIDRLRQPRSRADELRTLRTRLAAQPHPSAVSAEESSLANELRELRLALSQAVGAVESCKTCAIGHPPPHGHFAGGHCCGLKTEDAFNDDELAALRQAGTTAAKLRPPPAGSDHAGCSFRGPQGCSLSVPDRPNLCLRYLCPDLQREVSRRGDLEAIEAIGRRMEEVYLRFITVRQARLWDEEIAALSQP